MLLGGTRPLPTTDVVITEVMVNSEELTGTAEYLTLQLRCRINRCPYNRGE